MPQKYRISLLIVLITSFLFQGAVQFTPALAQNSVQFSETEVINHFPDELVFRVRVTSTGAYIESAKFAFTNEGLYSSRSYTKDPIDITAGTEVILEYVLDTRDFTTPPMMAYLFHWEVVDSDGNKYQSDPVTINYEDNRYDWQVLENDDIGVWWHDRSEAFGQTIFDIAADSVTHQQELFQTDLDFQMRIVISNSDEEFNSWHNIAHDWIGGQTFSNYGITNQIIKGENYQDAWLNSVIPHEISHIYFNQVVHNPIVSVPVWLNEGVAQYNEFISHDWEMNQVENAAQDGKLVPLSALEDGFGSYDVDRIYLSYAEAYSATAYLVETYGNVGLSSLLAAYKEGEPTDEAFQTALGISADQFELDWAASVGAENYLIPTAWVLPTFFPSPTSYILAGQGTAAPGQDPAETPAPPSADTQSGAEEPTQTQLTIMPFMIIVVVIAVLGIGIGVVVLIYFMLRKQDSNEI